MLSLYQLEKCLKDCDLFIWGEAHVNPNDNELDTKLDTPFRENFCDFITKIISSKTVRLALEFDHQSQPQFDKFLKGEIGMQTYLNENSVPIAPFPERFFESLRTSYNQRVGN